MKRYICIHGHFYQPPRENPWLEEVELQDSARPFHDWNERITAECYGPNAASRILDNELNIIDIVNNYSKISFNFGPTLLSWMEKHAPDVHEAIVEADRLSRERFSGHGSALAQVYNHMIMPLASTRDKRTQAIWGIEDFRKRFDRDPEGMWLPETAVDLETLDILSELGIKFTILSPRQAASVQRVLDKKQHRDVSGERIDPTTPYICKLPSGRRITLFFYDGPISQDLAFGDMLSSGEIFRNRLFAAFTEKGRDWPQLVHIATDGETYGHHHLQGEMALSYCLYLIEDTAEVTLTNYGEYLEKNPPRFEVEIYENSSWSCIHGVERWRSDCGCSSGMKPEWHQQWRKPLRDTMDWLGDTLAGIYDKMGPRYFSDPWGARDAYIQVISDRSDENVQNFLRDHAPETILHEDGHTALSLLEMQRYSQLIFTSCGWFFDELSGIENVQVLQYALRAVQIAEELTGRSIEPEFVKRLQKAPSNVLANGAEVFERYVKPAKVDMLRVGAHYAISSLFEQHPEDYRFGCYRALSEVYSRAEMGRSSVCTGKARITSVTTRQQVIISFAALHLGEHNVTCGVNLYRDLDSHRTMEVEIREAFDRGDIAEAIRVLDRNFGDGTYSVYHLFRDEQRKVVNELLAPKYEAAEAAYRQIYYDNYLILNLLEWLNIPMSRELLDAAENVVNTDLRRLFTVDIVDPERLNTLITDARRFNLQLDNETLAFAAGRWLDRHMGMLREKPDDPEIIQEINEVLTQLSLLGLRINLADSQNIYFYLGKERMNDMRKGAESGDANAGQWLEAFENLGDLLRVRLS